MIFGTTRCNIWQAIKNANGLVAAPSAIPDNVFLYGTRMSRLGAYTCYMLRKWPKSSIVCDLLTHILLSLLAPLPANNRTIPHPHLLQFPLLMQIYAMSKSLRFQSHTHTFAPSFLPHSFTDRLQRSRGNFLLDPPEEGEGRGWWVKKISREEIGPQVAWTRDSPPEPEGGSHATYS